MKIIFAGGGTAGHINPALAVAQFIRDKEPNTKILYVGSKGGMEENLVQNSGFDFKGITISGFSRKLSLSSLKKNMVTLKRVFIAGRESENIINEFKPDICVGTGGYVSGPILRKAAKMEIPIVIHEQNAYPGVANKMLSKYAKVVMLAIPVAKEHFNQKCKFISTGNPVRKEIILAQRDKSRKKLNLDERPLILSFGGSLGARKVNEAIEGLIVHNVENGNKFQHIHAYGKYGKWFLDDIKDKGIILSEHKNLDIREYIDNMSECLAAADLVICRAGAITLSELQIQGKPSILIPSPNVAENHQYHNAMSMVNAGAANIIEEKDLSDNILVDTVSEMLSSKSRLEKYSVNAGRMAIKDSNDKIYNVIKSLVDN